MVMVTYHNSYCTSILQSFPFCPSAALVSLLKEFSDLLRLHPVDLLALFVRYINFYFFCER